jgi:uncharacterized protein
MATVAGPIALPPVPRIAAPALRGALIAGIRRVIARRELLNRINVFPVPDGDTGSNLAFTLSAVLSRSLSRRARSAGDLLRAVADDAIDSARGNSGAILAQFFHGLGQAAGRQRVLTPVSLAAAVRVGSEQAREALAEPQEGTILSVIRAFAEALESSRHGSLARWFEHALATARSALADTPRQLAVLRQAGVVDAGAQGFVDLLEGIQQFILHGPQSTPDNAPQAALPAFAGVDWHGEPDLDAPWCSECMLQAAAGSEIERAALQAALAALGARSVVLAGGAARLHLHAHVAEPGRLFEIAGRFGQVSGRKAEDMRMQHRSANAAGIPVAVLTDSGADLPAALQQALNIQMVAARVSLGEEEFLDKVSISPTEFYRRLRESTLMPQTSQPPPGDFRRSFDFLLGHHRQVVYVGLSRAVSGTLQAAEAAAGRCETGRITVFDSGHASCGEALLVIAAAEAARRGLDAPAIAARLARLRPRTHTFAIARDLSFGVRGGRVPRWAKPVIEGLGLTPVARIGANGRLRIAGALRGSRVAERFAAYIARRLGGGRWRLLVGHCDCADDGAALLAALQHRLDCSDAWLVEAGSAIGAHAGPGALVVGAQAVDGDEDGAQR